MQLTQHEFALPSYIATWIPGITSGLIFPCCLAKTCAWLQILLAYFCAKLWQVSAHKNVYCNRYTVCVIIYRHREIHRSSTSENSGGPMKTLIVSVLLSGKKSCGKPLYGDSYVERIILGPVKSLGGPVKLVFCKWLPVLWSGKGQKVFPMSVIYQATCTTQQLSIAQTHANCNGPSYTKQKLRSL